MIEAALRTHLLQQPAVAALVGSRVYPVRLPQGAIFLAITYQRIAGGELITHDGAAGLGRSRMQLDCWSDDGYAEAVSLAAVLRAALSGFHGAWAGVRVGGVQIVNELDLSEPEPELWRRTVEIAFWHATEAAA
jgi:hypothetical protein